MKIWVGSDLHFAHNNIMKFSPKYRQFNDVNHMNEEMIRLWNETVSPDDLTYLLGDIAFCDPTKAAMFVSRLNGRKILIEGNHDAKLVKHQGFRDCFESIHKYYEIYHNNTKVCMFHYPIMEWNQCHRGSVMLHGHLHGNPSGLEQYRSRDVGLDATGTIVTELDAIVTKALTGKIKIHGRKEDV